MERKRRERMAMDATIGINEENEGELITQDLTELVTEIINAMESEGETEASDAATTDAAEETRVNAKEQNVGLRRGSL